MYVMYDVYMYIHVHYVQYRCMCVYTHMYVSCSICILFYMQTLLSLNCSSCQFSNYVWENRQWTIVKKKRASERACEPQFCFSIMVRWCVNAFLVVSGCFMFHVELLIIATYIQYICVCDRVHTHLVYLLYEHEKELVNC